MQKERIQRLRQLSEILDTRFEGPFGIKFGLDPLIGLIPVLGDALTTLISFYIVLEAYNLGCSPAVLVRMVLNIFLEDAVKVVPFLGQVFDFYWKSNIKNVELVESYANRPDKTRKQSALLIGLLILSFLLVMTFILTATVYMVVWLVQLIRF